MNNIFKILNKAFKKLNLPINFEHILNHMDDYYLTDLNNAELFLKFVKKYVKKQNKKNNKKYKPYILAYADLKRQQRILDNNSLYNVATQMT